MIEIMRREHPLIGITTRPEDEKERYALSAHYVTSIRRAGGYPVLLPPGETNIGGLLQQLDGLILSGGGDIDPDLYGGRPHETIYAVNRKRDQSEIDAVQYAIESRLPTLGICRGIQVMNVALHGTLMEHLPDIVGNEISHRASEEEVCKHSVCLSEGSFVAKIFGQYELTVPSYHHQAIKQLALPLKAVAMSRDGIIEAVEMTEHPFFIGVQWHPELSDDLLQQRLFQSFVEAALQRVSVDGD